MMPAINVAFLLVFCIVPAWGAEPVARKPLTEWYYPDGIIMPPGTLHRDDERQH
jgi:hypothetical protein